MEIPDIEVITLSGEKFSLREKLDNVVEALRKDGCLLLKRATDISTIEPILLSDPNSVGYVKRDIVLNKAVKTILFAAQKDDFRITGYMPYQFGAERGSVGRDSMWEKFAEDPGLVGACCTHLGNGEKTSWAIEVYEDYRKRAKDQTITIRANGGDIFLCNTALQRWTPRLEKKPPSAAYAISVYYFRKEYPGRIKMMSSPEIAKEILHQAGDECLESDEHIIWKLDTT